MVALAVAASAEGVERQPVPDFYEAATAAAGISVVSFKQPNPLPVGPGAFMTFEVPEVAGGMNPGTVSARASVLYPGPLFVGLPALLCTAGVAPFCGQDPFGAVTAEAQHPQTPSAKVATEDLTTDDPSAPFSVRSGSGTAEATEQVSVADAEMGGYVVDAPDPARQAVLDALSATLGALPGGAPESPDSALIRIGGGRARQSIAPTGDGGIRAEAHNEISDISLLAGAIRIDSIVVDAYAVTDGEEIRESGSSTKTSGVTVGGFPASIGPDGIQIDGSGDDGEGRNQLGGVAAVVSDAVSTAVDKLDLEIRDGAATRAEDGSAAAADGVRIHLGNDALTEEAPPQVPEICTATDLISDPLSDGGLILPPICAVPDVTGTTDTYDFVLGKASVSLVAQMFPSFGDGGDPGGDTGLGAGFADPETGGSSPVFPSPTGGSEGFSPAPPSSSGGSTGSGGRETAASPVLDVRDPGFLAFERRWLGGDAAPGRLTQFYFALIVLGLALTVVSRFALRAAHRPAERGLPKELT